MTEIYTNPWVRFWFGVLLGVAAGRLIWFCGRPAFCRWRLAVWTRRLNRRQAIWSDVRLSTEQNIHWEAQVTKAQVQTVKWRRRVRAL